uniref:Centrosome and spindle pole associated protein 1 n=2 Tax=Erpetoichthys calabaricus TaxID=27687 RepID=A0A8C4RYX6_ERPCA
MSDDLGNFLEEQRAKVAEYRASLEQDPPYMEIRTKADFAHSSAAKENIPPNKWQVKQSPYSVKEESYGLSLPLGEEYEKKKQKLKQELRQDYRRYMAQAVNQERRKKNGAVSLESHLTNQGLSLPIGDRRSAKERLRSERNREYNKFLKEQRQTFQVKDPEVIEQNSKREGREQLPDSFRTLPVSRAEDYNSSKKDAATLTEAKKDIIRRQRLDDVQSHRLNKHPEIRERRPRFSRFDFDSELEDQHQYSDDEREKFMLPERTQPRQTEEREFFGKMLPRQKQRGDRDMPRYRSDRMDEDEIYPDVHPRTERRKNENRSYRERLEDAQLDYEDDYWEKKNKRPSSNTGRTRPNERLQSSTKKHEERFATGLMIGETDKNQEEQRRKERYRQELQEQIAEQQRNKKREKELGLRVAASGAVDPEKQPDRIKQFGAVNREYDNKARDVPYRPGASLGVFGIDKPGRPHEEIHQPEERAPPEKPRVAFQTPVIDYNSTFGALGAGTSNNGTVTLNEDFYRGLAHTLGEIMAPRVTSVPPPPAPPVMHDNYRTPYDDAYYYYGTRNPLDPSLAHYGPSVLGAQAMPFKNVGPGPAPFKYPEKQVQSEPQIPPESSRTSIGIFPEEKMKSSKDTILSYQEELKKQIQEREEKKRREKEENERYELKIEAEMKTYDPWGRGGAGAPLKDDRGNLISDLKRMHVYNEEAYVNPELRTQQEKKTLLSVPKENESHESLAHKISDFTSTQTSPFARGNVFTEAPTPQQIYEKDKYKEYLRIQIEEKRRKQEEERKRLQMEEEEEERRLAEQRTRMQREYEEELKMKKLKEEELRAQQMLKHQEPMNQTDDKGVSQKSKENDELQEESEGEQRAKQEENQEQALQTEDKSKIQKSKEKEGRKHSYEVQERREWERDELRQPSPPVPAVLNKMALQGYPKHPVAESVHSVVLSERQGSGAVSPPVPARRNDLRAAEERIDVMSRLPALNRRLVTEQQTLEAQYRNLDRDDVDTPLSGRRTDRNDVNVFDMARRRRQAPVRRPPSNEMDQINIQNFRDFNQLKYRNTDTREGVLQVYPDPPKDNHSLEIQQQALLREQERKLKSMKKKEDIDFPLSHLISQNISLPKTLPSDMRGSLLESESAFIGTNGEVFPTLMDPFLSERQLSARERRRQKKKKDFEFDDMLVVEPQVQPDSYSISSLNVEHLNAKNKHRLKRLEDFNSYDRNADDNMFLEDLDDDPNHFSSKDHARPYSVETVATDPWMRPGTSETIKRFMANQMRRERPPSASQYVLNWQGPSTSHG